MPRTSAKNLQKFASSRSKVTLHRGASARRTSDARPPSGGFLLDRPKTQGCSCPSADLCQYELSAAGFQPACCSNMRLVGSARLVLKMHRHLGATPQREEDREILMRIPALAILTI